jgi:hypothetical protein
VAITEAEIASYLSRRLHNLATLVGQTSLDESQQGFGDDIADALLLMEITSVGQITTAKDEAAVKHIAEFYALYRYASLLSTRVDIEAYAIDDERGRVFDNVIELMNQSAARLAAYGYVVTVGGDGGGGGSAIVGTWSEDKLDSGWLYRDRSRLERWP